MKLKNIIFSESTDQEQLKIIKVENRFKIPKDFTGISEYPDGSKSWFLNGKIHRENDLPAIEYPNKTKFWYLNGKKHRENDLPAVELSDGSKIWYLNGKRHRETGHAIEWPDGTKEWWLNGKNYSEEDWKKLVKNRHQNPNDILLESIKISI